jgi:ribosomal protein S18 acetylase RimI-like enzyme
VRSEREVHEMTRGYVRGKRRAEIFRVTATKPAGRLVGYAALARAAFPPDKPALAQLNGYPYIALISLSEKFRGLRKDGRRLGDLVLEDALAMIAGSALWGPASEVLALVDPRNKPSCDLFHRHGFHVIQAPPPEDTENDCVFWRPGA